MASKARVWEFPMVFPAGGATLVGRLYRNVDELIHLSPRYSSPDRG